LTARVTAAPSPLAAGHCAAVTVQLIDSRGALHTQLKDGRPLDPRTFRYATSDAVDFRWQNANPSAPTICTAPSTGAVATTITVLLPDGTSGSVVLANVPPAPAQTTQSTQPSTAVVPAAALTATPRPRMAATPVAVAGAGGGATSAVGGAPSSPPGAIGTSSAGGATSSGAGASGQGAQGAPSVVNLPPQRLTTAQLGITGPYFDLSPQTVPTSALSITGGLSALPPQTVATAPLGITGGLSALDAQTVTTTPLAITGPYFALPPQAATTTTLSITGSAAP